MAVLLSVVKIVGEILKIFLVVKDSGDDFLDGLRVGEFRWILFEDLLDWQNLSILKMGGWMLGDFLIGPIQGVSKTSESENGKGSGVGIFVLGHENPNW